MNLSRINRTGRIIGTVGWPDLVIRTHDAGGVYEYRFDDLIHYNAALRKRNNFSRFIDYSRKHAKEVKI